ncbi:HMA2 domain-containing protein [uncultured Mitsuokella sp.]|uniref:HMA2 domain-containing protein n=1 Tax=uncultured Mitsuokella sp. TaxID=453120 RepID=UPI0025EC287B|nr:hypothetical protein [uncultured Mitsuokella sp.]
MSLIGSLQIPTSKLDLFIRSVEIASYLPGRVRLRSKNLIGNSALEQQVQQQLNAFAEIEKVETSVVTGSILIHYVPEILRANQELRKVEEYIMTHARRK